MTRVIGHHLRMARVYVVDFTAGQSLDESQVYTCGAI